MDISCHSQLYRVLKNLKKSDEPKGGCDNSFDFLFCSGNPEDALLYYSLFCPNLIQVEGIVVFSFWQDSPKDFEELKKQTHLYQKGQILKEELQGFLSGFTYIELSHLFDRCNGIIMHEHEYLLAECIVSSWKAWFPSIFPEDRFNFSISPSSVELVDDIEISFEQDLK